MELVSLTTEDGFFLNASFQISEKAVPGNFPVDACLLIHGSGGNFTAPGVLSKFAEIAILNGLSVLRLNTRGHDLIANIPGIERSIKGGASYERLADSPYDLGAGVDFLKQRGQKSILLVGHSLGGVKACLYQSGRADPAVRALVMISAPRFRHSWFMQHPKADSFRLDYSRAKGMVENDQGQSLFQVTQPLPMLTTAAGFCDKYGPEDRYCWTEHARTLKTPLLYILGTKSMMQSPAFDGIVEEFEPLANLRSEWRIEIVEGGDTNYSGMLELPAEATFHWLQQW